MDPLRRKVRPLQHRNRKKPLSEEIRNMYRILSFTMLFLGIASTATYLYINSSKSANGYTLQQLESTFQSLQSEQRKLDHEIVEAQSFQNIEGIDHLNEMEESQSEDFSYLGVEQNFAHKE